jgi:hypothetical protein
MIAISSNEGELIKALPFENGKIIGFSRLYGFVSADVFRDRQQNRKRHGFRVGNQPFDFQFKMSGESESKFAIEAGRNCQAVPTSDGWQLTFGEASYAVRPLSKVDKLPIDIETEERERAPWVALALTLLVPLSFLLLPKRAANDEPVVVEQVAVQIKPEVQKQVQVKTPLDRMPEVNKQAQATKRAINQKLGFLGLLGRQDLHKAVGGVPTDLKDVSAGAGPGGKEGSGGELLVGLGQGLKRTTVGNTGVAGLGGVGTRGAGGGAGGYGNSAIGSGEGKGLSTIPLSQDLVLEGGLDRSVVQATIAKYLSQVRACYETGLKRNPGLGGQVTMAFEIGGEGDLNSSKVQKTSLDDVQVEECISQRMMTWKFPKPRGGVSVKVSYPFVLRSTHS